MFKTIANAWKLVDIRKKLLFTLLIIIVFRIGSVIPVPFLDMDRLDTLMQSSTGVATTQEENQNAWDNSLLGYLNTMSGGAFSNATLFAMSVTPYINASIIIQLLTVAIPALERLAKEGTEGRKKIATITRYVTVGLGLIQGTAYYIYLFRSGAVLDYATATVPYAIFSGAAIILTFTAGTALMMWMGEQINQYGIGNGISMLLFAGIISRLPVMINSLIQYWNLGFQDMTRYFFLVIGYAVLFVAVIWLIVFMNDAERRIPVQYAKRVVGRKMYGGQSSHLPIKVGMGGVLPVIFASSILSIPSTISLFVKPESGSVWESVVNFFSSSSWGYIILFFILILAFAYFYTTIQYNPIEMANNLRQNNGTVPGIRPGRPTADFIAKILSRITLIGALFLSVIAIVPLIYTKVGALYSVSMGGTSVIILVGVALDTVKQLESQVMMRHYKGFLD